MEEKQNKVWFVTLVLTLIGGYCDSITFVAADKIFSAHVTGNFIVFAYQLIKGGGADAWIKLMTFPVFMFSVMVGGWIAAKFSSKHFLLLIEGIVLLIAGGLAYGLGYVDGSEVTWPMYVVVMITVFAMGFQNAYGKLFAKDTFGPTTMMTGNVTQFALDIRSYCNSGFKNADFLSGIYKGFITLGGFLLGCILGAWIGKLFGLTGMILPGIAMAICYFSTNKTNA